VKDTGIYYIILPLFSSLIAKVCAEARTRIFEIRNPVACLSEIYYFLTGYFY